MNDIIEKFEDGTYSLTRIPRIFEIDCFDNVYIHNNVHSQDNVQALNYMRWEEQKIKTQKIKASSYGEYTLVIGKINIKYFKSRERLDALYSKEWEYSKDDNSVTPITIEQISFEEALKLLTVNVEILGDNIDKELVNDNISKELVDDFKEFRILFSDGNDKFATAQRGDYYFVFYYITS